MSDTSLLSDVVGHSLDDDEALLASTPPSPGQPLREERYRIVSALGAGGMGRVYLAQDLTLDRLVALKVIPATGDRSARESRQLLLTEAQALAKLSHPNVVQIYDVSLEGDDLFIAMEYVPGSDLSQWLREELRSRREVLRMFLAAGEGLAAAHAAGLVHCDVKPSNILLGQDGRIRISDFGLAALPHADGQLRRGGTRAYRAPEQSQATAEDPRADQYSFCVALFEALCDQRPFPAGRALDEPIRWPPGHRVPRRLRAAIERGLAREPSRRFHTMRACLNELSRPWWRPRHPVRALAATAAIATVAMVGVGTRMVRARRCSARAAEIEQAWNADVQQRLDGAFYAAVGEDGRAPALAVSQAFDAFVGAWMSAEREACEANDADSGLGECLTQRRLDFEALVRRYGSPDRRLVMDAPRAAQLLTLPRTCVAQGVMSSGALAPRLLALQTERARVTAAEVTGQYRETLEVFPALRQRAHLLGRTADEAELLLAHGRVLLKLGDAQNAEGPLFEAATLAAELRLPDVGARSWLLLSQRAQRLGTLDEAERALKMADALATHDADPRVRLEVTGAGAVLAANRGAVEHAIRVLEEAIAAATALGSNDATALSLRASYSRTLFLAQRYEQALQVDRGLLETLRRTYGENHADVAKLHVSIAASLGSLRRHDEAFEHLLRGIALVKVSLGEQSVAMVDARNNLANVQISRGNTREGLEEMAKAVALAQEVLGPENPKVARLTANLGLWTAQKLDLRRGAALLEEALNLMVKSGRGEHADSVSVRTKLAHTQLVLGNPERARALAEAALRLARALDLRVDTTFASVTLGAALVSLHRPGDALPHLQRAWSQREGMEAGDIEPWYGLALWETGADREEGLRLMEATLARAETNGPGTGWSAAALSRIRAALRQHKHLWGRAPETAGARPKVTASSSP